LAGIPRSFDFTARRKKFPWKMAAWRLALGAWRLAFVASSTFVLAFTFFLMYLKIAKHSVQTRCHRGSAAFDLEELEKYWREEGECQILHDFA